MSYYAVRVGRTPGIYSEWSDCKQQIEGFSGAEFKKFNSRQGALDFIAQGPSKKVMSPSFTLPPTSTSASAVPKVSTRLEESARNRGSDKRKTILTIDSASEEEVRARARVTIEEKPTVPGTVAELIEMKRQQAKQRRREKRLEAESETDASSGGIGFLQERASMTTSSTSSIGLPQSGALLKRKHSSPERNPRPQKRSNTTLSTPEIEENKIVVYADGACSSNGRDGAIAGIGVYFGDNDSRNASEPLEGDKQTNQRAELTAAIRGLEIVSQHHSYDTHVELHTDSIYVVKGITQWIYTWKRQNWISSSRTPVSNKDLWVRLDSLNSRFKKVSWVHVMGHSGVKGNEEADKLATTAAAAAARARDR